MEGLDLGQTSNPSLAWKMDVLKINGDDDDDDDWTFLSRYLSRNKITSPKIYTY